MEKNKFLIIETWKDGTEKDRQVADRTELIEIAESECFQIKKLGGSGFFSGNVVDYRYEVLKGGDADVR